MLKPVSHEAESLDANKRPRRKKPLKRIAMLPTLVTLGSVCFGFAAIYACARQMEDMGAGRAASDIVTLHSGFLEEYAGTYLSIAAWLVLGGMFCDAIDGAVARRVGASSRFGEQLDSLADVVTFGVAPAFMVVTLVREELLTWGQTQPLNFDRFGQLAFLAAMIYVCCTALRLARFNVEATMEEAMHTGFRGLPSPGAAGMVIALVYFQDQVQRTFPNIADGVTVIIPFATLFVGLLMVSRVPYFHFVGSFLKKQPFGRVIPVLIFIPLMIMFTEYVAVLMGTAFVISGPIYGIYLWSQGPKPASATASADNTEWNEKKRVQ